MTPFFTPTVAGEFDLATRWRSTLPDGMRIAPVRRRIRPLVDLLPLWEVPESPPVPELPPVPARVRPASALAEVKRWTGWSSRTLAHVLDTSHPTIEAILQARARLIRLPDLPDHPGRIDALHRVVSRLRPVVGGDPEVLRRVLDEPPAPGAPNAVELFRQDRSAAAYLAALDVVHPPGPADAMIAAFPAHAGEATASLDDG